MHLEPSSNNPVYELGECLKRSAKQQLLDLRKALRELEAALNTDNENKLKGALVAIRLMHEYMQHGCSFDAVKAIREFDSM